MKNLKRLASATIVINFAVAVWRLIKTVSSQG